MSEMSIPWHNSEIFHDDIGCFPVLDYFPLKVSDDKASDSYYDVAEKMQGKPNDAGRM